MASSSTSGVASDERPLTNGEMAAFRRCRRKWLLQYVMGLKPAGGEQRTEAMAVGSQAHELLRRHYAGVGYDVAAEDTPTVMANGYVEWLEETGADRGFTSMTPEVSVSARYDDLTLLAKPDLWAIDRRENHVMIDFKTVTTLGQFSEKATRETQPLHYMLVHLLRELELPIFEYRVLRRCKRTASAKPPFYDSVPVYHRDSEVWRYGAKLRAQVTEMRALEREALGSPAMYPNPGQDCEWSCPFKSICPHVDGRPETVGRMLDVAFVRGDPLAHHKEEETL